MKLITTIPSEILFEIGTEVPEQYVSNIVGNDRENSELRKGQVLWLRGIARLQTQVCSFLFQFDNNPKLLSIFISID